MYNKSFIMNATWNCVLEKEESLETVMKGKGFMTPWWNETESLRNSTSEKLNKNREGHFLGVEVGFFFQIIKENLWRKRFPS